VKVDLPHLLSIVHHYFVGVPVAVAVGFMGYLAIVGLALSKKDEVEASAWHGNTGFSIRARGRNMAQEKGRKERAAGERRRVPQ
jgi:hypothetical protein